MAHSFSFRPGTCDEEVFNAVVRHNEYRLPESFAPDDIVVDIGTHIGSFCYAAAQRGSRRVYGFEAFVENHQCATRNLAALKDCVTIQHKAVWRSDRAVEKLLFNELDKVNTGAGHVLRCDQGLEVDAIAFDAIIRQVTRNGRDRVRLVKMDCEGSEFPILLTSRTLHLIDGIVGEYHNYTKEHRPEHPFYEIAKEAEVEGFEQYTILELAYALRLSGFQVKNHFHPIVPTLAGWFEARRDARPRLPVDRLRWFRDGLKYKMTQALRVA